MMRLFAIAVSVVGLLAACGADGEPTRPGDSPTPGVSISGTAAIGIVGTN